MKGYDSKQLYMLLNPLRRCVGQWLALVPRPAAHRWRAVRSPLQPRLRFHKIVQSYALSGAITCWPLACRPRARPERHGCARVGLLRRQRRGVFHIYIRGRSDWRGYLYTFTHRRWPHCRGSRLTPGPVPTGDSDSKCAAD